MAIISFPSIRLRSPGQNLDKSTDKKLNFSTDRMFVQQLRDMPENRKKSRKKDYGRKAVLVRTS